MLIKTFIENIKTNCSPIATLCVEHIINKIYKNIDEVNDDKIEEFFSNYSNYNKYLNDYAGTIYNKHSSSVDSVYIEICKYLDIDVDNKYTLEYVIIKLERQNPQLILDLLDSDIQIQTIENFDEKLESIFASSYYNANIDEFKIRVDKLTKNITLVKSALQIS